MTDDMKREGYIYNIRQAAIGGMIRDATHLSDVTVLLDALDEARGRLHAIDAAVSERDDEWRDASGLTNGGDPGGIEPRHLRRFVADASHVISGTLADLTRQGINRSAMVLRLETFQARWPDGA